MRKALLLALLVLVPLVVVPWAVTFDASKAFLLCLGALVLAGSSLPRKGDGGMVPFDFRWSPASAALAAAVAVYLFTIPLATDHWAAGRAAALLLSFAVVTAAFENIFLESWELAPFLRALAVTGGLVSAYGLLQVAGIDFPFPWRDIHPDTPVSTLGNPNFAAEFAAACLPVQALAVARSAPAGKMGGLLGILLTAALFYFTRGRTAVAAVVLGGALGAAVELYAHGGGRRLAGRLLGGLVLGGVALVAGLVYAPAELPSWLATAGRTDTILVRRDLARGTLAMVAEHPLGVGAGNWAAAHPPYRTEAEYRASLFRDPGEAHNEPLQFAAEGGWLFALAAAAWLVLLGRTALRAADRGEDPGLAAVLAATAGVVLVSSLASPSLHKPAMLVVLAFATGGLAFLGGPGTLAPLGVLGTGLHRLVVLLLVVGTVLLGSATLAEGPQAEARLVLRSADPLPPADARRALDLLDRSLFRDPGNTDALSRAGVVALNLGAAESDGGKARALFLEAERRFARLLALRPLDPQVLANAAAAAAALGRDGDAEALWNDAIGTSPWHREARQGLGFHLLRLGQPGRALEQFDVALRVDPDYAPAAARRAEALIALERDAEAMEFVSLFVDRLAGRHPVDLRGLDMVARRCAAASPLLARMILGKGARGGVPADVSLVLLEGVVAGRPEEDLQEAAAIALAESNRPAESARLRVRARFSAAETALAAGDRDLAAKEARRALEIPLATTHALAARVEAAGVLCRAGKREETLAELGVAVARGYGDADALEANPAFAALRGDPAFLGILQKARR